MGLFVLIDSPFRLHEGKSIAGLLINIVSSGYGVYPFSLNTNAPPEPLLRKLELTRRKRSSSDVRHI